MRELIQYKFTNLVLNINSKILGLHDNTSLSIKEFLFGENRHMPPEGLKIKLARLQNGQCLYTNTKLPNKSFSNNVNSLDHVVPWSRLRLSAIENFICTTRSVNSSKGNLLLSYDLLYKWLDFQLLNIDYIHEIAIKFGWISDFNMVVSCMFKIYSNIPFDSTHIYRGTRKGNSLLTPLKSTEKSDILEMLKNVAKND